MGGYMTKILVIEDDTTIAMGLKYSLEVEGFFVDIANCVEIGLKKIDEEKFDLLLLDLMLPDGTGYDVCNKVNSKDDIGIIFLTACDEEVNIIMGLDMGGDDYITKPFRVRELISRIKSVLRRKGKIRNEVDNKVIDLGEIKIHTLEGKVYKSGKEIVITALEYKLLLMLAQNSGKIISRSHILEGLWDVAGDFVNDNTLTVYIKRLREKIEDIPSSPKYIVTIRGLGYKWNRSDSL